MIAKIQLKFYFLFILIILFIPRLSAIEKIGNISQENVTSIGLLKDDTILYSFYKEKKTKTANVIQYYLNINGIVKGPYDDIYGIHFSDDRARYSCVTRIGYQYFIETNQQTFGPYDSSSISIIDKGESDFIFIISHKKKYYLINNNIANGPYDNYPRDLKISITGSILTYTASISNKKYLINGDKSLGPYDDINDFLIDDYGNLTAYSFKVDDRWRICTVNDIINSYDKVSLVSWNYVNQTPMFCFTINKLWYYFNGEKEFGPFEELKPLYSPDRKFTNWFTYKKDEHWFISNMDSYFGPFSSEFIFEYYNKNDEIAGFTSLSDNQWFIFNGESKYGPYNEIWAANYTNDKNEVAYSALHEDGWYVHYQSLINGPFISCKRLTLSPDSNKLAYYAHKEDGYYMYLQDQPIDGPFEAEIMDIQFSEDSNHLAYVCYANGDCILVNNEERLIDSDISIDDIISTGDAISYSSLDYDSNVIFSKCMYKGEVYIGYIWHDQLIYYNGQEVYREIFK